MKPPGPEGTPQLDVSIEELEALLEQARQKPLLEDGYQKLFKLLDNDKPQRAAIHTLGYVTELLEKKETTLAALRELLCPASTEKTDQVLKQAGIEMGEKKPGPESASKKSKRKAPGHGQRRRRVCRGAEGQSSARFKNRRCVPGWVRRRGLSAARSRCAGADQGTGAHCRDRL